MIDFELAILRDEVAGLIFLDKQFPKKVLRTIQRDALPPLSRALDRNVRRYPPERNPAVPFVWSFDPAANARARRWFFANYPNGYQRTGDLGEAWYADILLRDGSIIISLENETRGASYVHGSDEYGQVPGHVRTGWRHVNEIAGQYAELTTNTVNDVYEDYIEKFINL